MTLAGSKAVTSCSKRKVMASMLGVLVLVLNMFSATAAAEAATTMSQGNNGLASLNEIDSEEQLAILKQSVLDYAMDRNASIAAASWTDNDGALNEEVMMFSNLQLEKLRPQPYINRFGLKGTRLVESDTANSIDGSAEQSCSRPGARRQRLKLIVAPGESADTSVLNLIRDGARLIREDFKQAARFGALQDATMIESKIMGASAGADYLQYMVLGEAVTTDLEVMIRLSGRPEKKILERFRITKSSRGPIRLNVEIIAQSSLGVQFRQSGSILVKSDAADKRAQKAWLGLPKAAATELAQWSAQAVTALGANIRCDTGSAIVIAHKTDGGLLMAGKDVGLFYGQKFLIMPSSALVQRQGLERALSSIGLAQITRLNNHTASIDVYAGPEPRSYNSMIAIPLAALAP
jgi:hypothetical protein|tara:strand:- start:5726 stop:6946 length:1221 start_codon:yes stop_codon:yes gene_type:complete